jgi:hypothetical protein
MKLFNIHHVYSFFFKIWRGKRMEMFESCLNPTPNEKLLDVGGFPSTWLARTQRTASIDCLNIHEISWIPSENSNHQIRTLVGDGCSLDFKDGEYDIVFSNSVIEHVGDWQKQKDFANEVRRVGKKLWIQTPAFECPIEPHFLAPFVHWFPVPIRRYFLRWLTPWGWMERPSQDKVDEIIKFTKLLTKRQVRDLFPDCEILTERMLGIIPKSYIAYRVDVSS